MWAGKRDRQTLVPFVRYHKCTLSCLNPFLAGEGDGKEQGCTEKYWRQTART